MVRRVAYWESPRSMWVVWMDDLQALKAPQRLSQTLLLRGLLSFLFAIQTSWGDKLTTFVVFMMVLFELRQKVSKAANASF
jgi:hypothetical protein